MKRPPFFAFYPADFAGDIRVEAMAPAQVGAYLLLLCKAWQADPPASLPNDDAVLARLARMTPVEWSEAKAGVLAPFVLGTDNRWHQKRLRQEFQKSAAHMRKRSKAGEAGAAARWHADDKRIPGPSESDRDVMEIEIEREKKKKDKDPPNPPPGGGRRAAKPAVEVVFPADLETADFRTAWAEWKAERKARGNKPYTPTGENRQLAELARHGPGAALAAIAESTRNGWAGLFPEKHARGAPQRSMFDHNDRVLDELADLAEETIHE